MKNYQKKINKALSEENKKIKLEHATLLTCCNIIKTKTSRYFRKLNNIGGDENTQELDQWIVDEELEQNDEDLEQKNEDENQETIKQHNEETKSDIIEIVNEEQSDEINNSECFKTLQYIHKILGIFIF